MRSPAAPVHLPAEAAGVFGRLSSGRSSLQPALGTGARFQKLFRVILLLSKRPSVSIHQLDTGDCVLTYKIIRLHFMTKFWEEVILTQAKFKLGVQFAGAVRAFD